MNTYVHHIYIFFHTRIHINEQYSNISKFPFHKHICDYRLYIHLHHLNICNYVILINNSIYDDGKCNYAGYFYIVMCHYDMCIHDQMYFYNIMVICYMHTYDFMIFYIIMDSNHMYMDDTNLYTWMNSSHKYIDGLFLYIIMDFPNRHMDGLFLYIIMDLFYIYNNVIFLTMLSIK